MGFSYPANAGWRLWALAKAGRADVIVSDLRKRWAPMASVRENNTLQEDWEARHDSGQQWSHCAVVPLYIAHHGLMGLKPLEPGFRRFELRPQLGDLADLELTAFTDRGPIAMRAQGKPGGRQVQFEFPPDTRGELLLTERESADLKPAAGKVPAGQARFALPANGKAAVYLKHT
jgi:alpha-L-rhamnosidase